MKFNKLGLVAASASAVLALAGCNLIPNLADPGTTTGGGQQQQQQQTAPDANTATKPSDTRAGDSDSQQLYQTLMDKHNTSEQITNVQKYVDDVKKTGDKTEVTVAVTGIGVDFENSNGYLVEVVNKTDTNIFIQSTDTAVGKDELNLFVNAAPNTTTKGYAYFDPGVKMDAAATVRGTILALYGSDYSMDSFSVMF